MIVNSTASHEQRQVFAPDHVRTLDFTSPDLVSRAAEGARMYVKDLFGNNNFGLPSTSSTGSKSSSSRRTLSRLSLRSSIPEPTLVSQGPFRSSAPFRARPLSAPVDKVHRNLSSTLEASTQDHLYDSVRRSRMSEDYAMPSSPQRKGFTPRVSLDERVPYTASSRRKTEHQEHASRLDWKQQLDASDTHLIRSTADLRRRQSEVMYLKKRNNSDLTNGTLPSPISSSKSHEDTSPVSSDSLSESEHTSAEPTVEPAKPKSTRVSSVRESTKEREKLLDTIQSLRKQNDSERQARQTLRKQSEEVKQSHHKITILVNTLREQLKQVRNTMNDRAEEFATQQAEVVRLLMDSKEAHAAAQEKLIADRIHIMERWEREFKLRRKLFNQVQELRGNIRVFCRVRPLKQPKLDNGGAASLAADFPDADLGDNGSIRLGGKTFDFDYVFQPQVSQSQVYEETSGVVASVMDGYNVCVFAYGQTGSGKTHTMNGPTEDRGVNFRALMELFQIANERSEHSDIRISVSMLEIYNETLRDLILPDSATNPPKLDIRRNMNASSSNAVHIPNLTEVNVDTVEDVWEVMHYGAANRSKGRTNMNEHSSRSHLVLKVTVVCEKYSDGFKSSGVLHLVDLAGSERVARSQATGDRLREAQHINKSLATLGDVFTALNNHSSHVPYRNSKLTYLLQDCLGGDSKTLMFVNISADELDANESLSSLQFAQRVARVELKGAHRHTERTGEARALAALQAKENETKSLQTKISSLERELKRKGDSASELERKVKSLESQLRTTKRTLNDRMLSDMEGRAESERDIQNMKALQEKAESDARSAIERARAAADLVQSKDEEIKRLKALLEARGHYLPTEDGIVKELPKSLEDVSEEVEEVEPVRKVARPISAPAGSLTSLKTPLSRLSRNASTFTARTRQVRFDEKATLSGPSRTDESSTTTQRKASATPMPEPRRASSSSLPRGQTMHNSRFQRQSLARVPPSSSTAKRMSYGYGTRTDASFSKPESSSSNKPVRNARLPRARTITSRPPQRVVQPGTRQPPTSTNSGARPPSAPPRRMGTIASGIDRVVSGKLPPKSQNP
ncbi:Kinesin [Gracilaria domingensis]|nr:Kinesin [Gracilaria domingensis]